MGARVWLVDGQEIVRRGVSVFLRHEAGLEVVGESASASHALALVPEAAPDVVVLDLQLPDGDGVRLCRELLARRPELAVLVFTSVQDDRAQLEAMAAGASGFLLKHVKGSDIVAAVRAVAAGHALPDEPTRRSLVARLRREQERNDPLRELTAQQRTVLDLLGEGLTNRQIAQRMHLAEKTVKNYVSFLLRKLGLQRRAQAAVLACRMRQPSAGQASSAAGTVQSRSASPVRIPGCREPASSESRPVSSRRAPT